MRRIYFAGQCGVDTTASDARRGAFGLFLVLLAFGATTMRAGDCAALGKLALPQTVISAAEAEAAGTFTPPGMKSSPNLPAFCRVAGEIQPSADSHIQFEVWLPDSEWNGKFQGVGNGGYAGSISYAQMAAAVAHHYATASTDTGHAGEVADAEWALGHPDKIVDFGYRAIHETAVRAKAIVKAYYGNEPRRSYFSSCSNGGRQALMEAQRFPEDYDGIIAGAPANYWTHLLTKAAFDTQTLLGKPGSYIPPTKLRLIANAALEACDALDGVKDGVIEDPTRCHFDPGPLECKGPESDTCLASAQVAALRKLYEGPRGASGARIFPGYSPGGEAEPGGWAVWVTGLAPGASLAFAFGTQFFKNMVYSDPQWDYHTFDLDRDVRVADERMAGSLNATNPDLSRFAARRGKLILYHGWSDAAIPALNTIDYYQSVLAKSGQKKARSFVRLFMVPGMQHCAGGPGPDDFGEYRVAEGKPENNIDDALERWVEEGVAPERIVAAKHENQANPASPVVRTRPLCAYPLVAQYKGSGSTDEAANFGCAAAKGK
jgi:hypothetical protein